MSLVAGFMAKFFTTCQAYGLFMSAISVDDATKFAFISTSGNDDVTGIWHYLLILISFFQYTLNHISITPD